jgi:hypothetical protein
MADLIKELVSGVVDAALKEVLKKTGVRRSPTRRTRRKTTKAKTSKSKASGGILSDIIDAALNGGKKTATRKATRPRKQVSRRRTAASRSRQRTT